MYRPSRATPRACARPTICIRHPASDATTVLTPCAAMTEDGLRNNVNVAIQYLSSWLRGNGAAAIFNLMEDAATAEISRSQVWQWQHQGAKTADGQEIDADYVSRIEHEELQKIRDAVGEEVFAQSRAKEAQELFEQVSLGAFVEFLTLPAYDYLD